MVAKAVFDEIRSLGFAGISGSYANIGSALTKMARAFIAVNDTDGDMMISLDGGTTDHLYLPAGSFQLFDVGANAQQADDKYVLEIGTQFAVKQVTAPTEKSIYISVLR